MALAVLLHLLGVIVWVGGMAFAWLALRPALGVLPPPQRLSLLAAVFGRFLRWVGVAVVLIVGSGAAMIGMAGGLRSVGSGVHAMTGLGLAMTLIYAYIVLVPFPQLRNAVAAGEWERGGAAMTRIRRLVATNLILGLIALPFAVAGR